MKTRVLILTMVAILAVPAFAANEEMRKLDWMVGDWSGEATVQMGPGKTEHVLQTEKVQSRLDGKILLIEGLGKRKLEDGSAGDVVHDALAVLSWDEAKKNYRFSAYLAGRPGGDAALEVTGPNSAVWGFETSQGKTRYTITHTEEGEWLEIGEFSRDGEKWMKFMDMRLRKVK